MKDTIRTGFLLILAALIFFAIPTFTIQILSPRLGMGIFLLIPWVWIAFLLCFSPAIAIITIRLVNKTIAAKFPIPWYITIVISCLFYLLFISPMYILAYGFPFPALFINKAQEKQKIFSELSKIQKTSFQQCTPTYKIASLSSTNDSLPIIITTPTSTNTSAIYGFGFICSAYLPEDLLVQNGTEVLVDQMKKPSAIITNLDTKQQYSTDTVFVFTDNKTTPFIPTKSLLLRGDHIFTILVFPNLAGYKGPVSGNLTVTIKDFAIPYWYVGQYGFIGKTPLILLPKTAEVSFKKTASHSAENR